MSTVAPTSGWSDAVSIVAGQSGYTYTATPGAGGSILLQWSADNVEWVNFTDEPVSVAMTGGVPAAANYLRGMGFGAAGSFDTLAPSTPGVLTPAQLAALNNGNILAFDGSIYALSEVTPYVTLTATGLAFSGACELAGWYCSVAAGNITVYDALSATGTPIVPATALVAGPLPIFGAGTNGRLSLTTGCYVVLSGAATVRVAVG